MTLALLLAAGRADAQTVSRYDDDWDDRVYYAVDIYDDVDAEMVRCLCDDWADPVRDLTTVRGYEDYDRWSRDLVLATRPSGQLFDGTIRVHVIAHAVNDLPQIQADIDSGLYEKGYVWADEIVPDEKYDEYVVYEGPGGPNLALDGFVYEWINEDAANWDGFKDMLKDWHPNTDKFVYAKEVLSYTEPPAPGAPVNQFAADANRLVAYEVRQAADGPVVGWLMRERKTIAGAMWYVDHWALSDDFEMLSKVDEDGDGVIGRLAIVTPVGGYESLGQWISELDTKVPAVTTYAQVPKHKFGALAGGGVAAP